AGHTNTFKGFDVSFNVSLSRYTSFRVGGPADVLAIPERVDTLVALLKTARTARVPVTVLGGGTNTLVTDSGIRGLVIVLTGLKTTPEFAAKKDQIRLTAMAGEKLGKLCRMSAEKGYAGLEWAAGIPGTLGGAIMMNAGSHGSDMAAIVGSVDILNPDTLEINTLNAGDLNFSYRSLDLGGRIILSATLQLTPAAADRVKAAFETNLKAKNTSQPVSKASGGCFFKNPSPDKPAGLLIEQAGLKGTTYGGAMVSDLHANFIINHDNADCSDITTLAANVQERVFEKFNIKLEAEVKTIGD
ncbi:MAG TPA: UDP-N-acetylenolpyruvoylglucosamine reductase, partial [Desulfobacteraceae bacterium]|nr:UDP-N-acetylenolpyruvoylglucosamine reductase [Desulfobacteraceae bacterium]